MILNCVFRVKNSGKSTVNYLDDYFFASFLKTLCNAQIRIFLDICKDSNFPVSMEKTYWDTTRLVFLELLINTILRIV